MLRRLLARVGYLSIGAVYAAVGIIAARVAFLGARDRVAGLPGAFRFVLRQPHGSALLAGIVVGLAAFSSWRFSEAWRRGRGPFQRLALASSGVGYAVLAWTGLSLLLRVRSTSGGAARRVAFEWILSRSWGPSALTAAGIAVIASALAQLVQALRGRLPERFSTRPLGRGMGTVATRIARIGVAARAIVFGIVGYFLIRAAEERDLREFHEVGGALRLLSGTVVGPWLMGVVALGLVAFALYMGMMALFRRA